jgi:hypothetical protein
VATLQPVLGPQETPGWQGPPCGGTPIGGGGIVGVLHVVVHSRWPLASQTHLLAHTDDPEMPLEVVAVAQPADGWQRLPGVQTPFAIPSVPVGIVSVVNDVSQE